MASESLLGMTLNFNSFFAIVPFREYLRYSGPTTPLFLLAVRAEGDALRTAVQKQLETLFSAVNLRQDTNLLSLVRFDSLFHSWSEWNFMLPRPTLRVAPHRC